MSDDLVPEFRLEDLQDAAMAIGEAWMSHDEAALARLTPEQRKAQHDARWALLRFVDDYRESAKDRDENAVYHAPRWQVVAGLKDLFEQLAIAADEARAVAGDLDD